MKRFLVLLTLSLLAATPKPVATVPSPISLSDTDGQDLILEDLSARTAIEGMLSLTELDLRFRNPKPRRIEGRFSCTLPAHAAISRFAKEVNGQLMEGEVVERLRANQVYEQFLHQMRDPALLEQDQGNRFSARIFPIEANASVRIVLSYTTLLPVTNGVRTYALPLRGIPSVKHFTFRAYVSALRGEDGPGAPKSDVGGLANATHSTADVISLDEHDYVPAKDIELTWTRTPSASRARVIKSGDFYLAAFRPDVVASTHAAPHAWTFYVDTSASSAEGAEHRIHALESLFASLPPSDSVQVIAFDQEIAPLGSGSAAEMSRSIASLLHARLFLGGTDIGALLHAIANTKGDRAIVVASDLVATLGDTDRHAITEAIKSIPAQTTIDALILGSRQDAAVAKALTAGRGRIVSIAFSDTMDEQARAAADALRRPLGASFDVADKNAEWIYPAHFDDVQPGDEVIALGKVKGASDPAPRLGSEEPRTRGTEELAAGGPLLEREAYHAYLDYLAEREANEPSEAVRRALETEQVRVSVERRVVIPQTTMLVLENEWDYQRFGLDRRALASILTVDAGGIGVIDRRNPNVQPLPVPAQPFPMPAAKAAPQVQADRINAGVAGGVVGGTVTGAPAPTAAPFVAQSVTESVTVTAEAPMLDMRNAPPRPAPVAAPPPPPPPAPVPQKADTSWTEPVRPSDSDVAALRAKLDADPRDRDVYNKLSDALVARGEWKPLRTLALRWQPFDPESPQVYEVLGIADEKLGNVDEAARADASLIEVAAAKPELLQRAGLLLLRTKHAKLAESPLRRALELRPDRVNSYRHLALLLWRDGRPEEAARVLESATQQNFPQWYGDAPRVIREELGYVYRAWMAKDASKRDEIETRAREHRVDLSRRDALRVTLAWETDANDVDLHVVDPAGEECFYNHKVNDSGLELYQDITQGLGPEVIRTDKLMKGTYHVGVNYFAAGPMGVSRGIVVVMKDDNVDIYPFRLVEVGRKGMCHIAAIRVN